MAWGKRLLQNNGPIHLFVGQAIPVVTLALLALLFTACPARVRLPQGVVMRSNDELPPETRKLLAWLGHIFMVAKTHGDLIWPGYRPDKIPLLLFCPGKKTSFLVNSGLPPESYPRVADCPVDAVAIKTSALGLSANLIFAKSITFHNVKFFLVRYDPTMSLKRFSELLVHELFHKYQMDNWQDFAAPQFCRYPFEDNQNALRVFVEGRLLAHALRTDDPKEAEKYLQAYVTIRQQRYGSQVGEKVKPIELWEERLEGTARYVEKQYSIRLGLTSLAKTISELDRYFRHLKIDSLQKWRYYRTGMAMGIILDLLDRHTNSWKRSCEQGKSIFNYIENFVPSDQSSLNDHTIATIMTKASAQTKTINKNIEQFLEAEQSVIYQWQKQGDVTIKIVSPDSAGSAFYSSTGLMLRFEGQGCETIVQRAKAYVDTGCNLEIWHRTLKIGSYKQNHFVSFKDKKNSLLFTLDSALYKLSKKEASFSHRVHASGKHFRLNVCGKGTVVFDSDASVVEIVIEQLSRNSICTSTSDKLGQ